MNESYSNKSASQQRIQVIANSLCRSETSIQTGGVKMFAQSVSKTIPFMGIRSDRLAYWLSTVALLFIMVLAPQVSQAQGEGSRCRRFNGRATFWMSSSGFHRGYIPLFLNGDCTPPAEGSTSAGSHGMVDSSDRQSAIATCNRNNGGQEHTVSPFGQFWSCNPVDSTTTEQDGGGGSSSSSSRGSSRTRWSYVPPKPAGPPTGEIIQQFGIKVSSELGLHSGIQFQRRDSAAVGISSVIEMGVRDVVDVWGTIDGEYQVCFPQAGAIIFLDAASSPRTVETISYFVEDGYTCAKLDTAGMLVLIEPSESLPATTTVSTGSAGALSQCQVTTLYNLNLRTTPSSTDEETIVTVISYQTTMTSTRRTQGWFFVIHEDNTGWISARYVNIYGKCRYSDIA